MSQVRTESGLPNGHRFPLMLKNERNHQQKLEGSHPISSMQRKDLEPRPFLEKNHITDLVVVGRSEACNVVC